MTHGTPQCAPAVGPRPAPQATLNLKRLLLVVNRHASRSEAVAEMAEKALRAHPVELAVEHTDCAEDLTAAIRSRADQIDAVILVGGDGTLHHAATCLRDLDLPLGILPGGTANDFARCLATPASVRDACDAFMEARVVHADLGLVNGVSFLNVAHIGPGANVSLDSSGVAKRLFGVLEYLRKAIDWISKRRSFKVDVVCDGVQHRFRSIQVSVGNAPYYGGGNLIYDGSAINDNQLYLYSVRPLKLWHLLLIAPMLRRGRGDSTVGVDRLHGKQMTVKTSVPLPISADGEAVGTTPAEFQIIPNALNIIMPSDHSDNVREDLILDDRQVALQQVTAALHEAADYYHEAASRLEEQAMRELFESLAQGRNQSAEEMSDHVRRVGALPREPDRDRETLEHLAKWLIAQLSEDGRRSLITGSIERDRGIQNLMDEALACELPDQTRQRLQQEHTQLGKDIDKLRALIQPH